MQTGAFAWGGPAPLLDGRHLRLPLALDSRGEIIQPTLPDPTGVPASIFNLEG